MSMLVQAFLQNLVQSLMWMAYFALTFGVLTKIWPCNPDLHYWKNKKQWMSDLGYWLVLPLFSRYVKIFFMTAGAVVLLGLHGEAITEYYKHGHGALGALPLVPQAVLLLILSDIPLYFIHRFFHGRSLWKYHAVHHSTKDLDWMSTQRFHPINSWFAFTLVDTLMLIVGFSPQAFASLALFNIAFSAFVHANLNWTLGPLKYVIATPVFHRWHHTMLAEGRNKNFAPTFPILDIIGGTFYMPKGKLPEHYGIDDETFPEDFVRQLFYPFRK